MDAVTLWSKIRPLDCELRVKSSFSTLPLAGKKVAKKVTIDRQDHCRENLAHYLREDINVACWNQYPPKGKQNGGVFLGPADKLKPEEWTPKTRISLEPSAGTTTLTAEQDADIFGDNYDFHVCMRECCIQPMLQLLDTIVGLPCLLLNPEREKGDWWRTSLPEVCKKQEILWKGVDTSILRHPVLTSLILGFFRQAICMHTGGVAEKELEALAPYAEVKKVLDSCNMEKALKLAERLEPLLASRSNRGEYFPVSVAQWPFFLQLCQAIRQHGYDKVFDGTLEENMRDLHSIQQNGSIHHKGFQNYFGLGYKQRVTAAKKRVLKLVA